MPQRYIFLIIFFVSEHLSSATENDAKCHMWHLCRYLRKPAALCFIFGGGGGGRSGKQTCSWGSAKRPFLVTKWAQNGVILVGLGLGP